MGDEAAVRHTVRYRIPAQVVLSAMRQRNLSCGREAATLQVVLTSERVESAEFGMNLLLRALRVFPQPLRLLIHADERPKASACPSKQVVVALLLRDTRQLLQAERVLEHRATVGRSGFRVVECVLGQVQHGFLAAAKLRWLRALGGRWSDKPRRAA